MFHGQRGYEIKSPLREAIGRRYAEQPGNEQDSELPFTPVNLRQISDDCAGMVTSAKTFVKKATQ
jgi:hypothetical protein